ncbi:MAG: cytochrome c [Cyclobacteriaceae bacterium]|nr:c-type cytochrome [Cyclobacteriaceae bacterium]MCB0499764.1 c-type cytochrome [Cyclobacteriaceae bacterium]MCB9238572.1 c-type cytochrome [Flammeovirgaceae bacterium]MCO5271744.1 cytochrome c [Cyclobacteriaceae bacterium]
MKQSKLVFCFVLTTFAFTVFAQRSPEILFTSFCATCHTINKGKLIGPDLVDVNKRRSEAWLLEFITSSQTMINKGDPDAVALFKEYNQMIMPDAPYNADEIKSILGYIKTKSPGYVAKADEGQPTGEVNAEPEEPVRSVDEATPSEIEVGRMLFAGEQRLEGRGPACISCHNVKNDRLIGGGLLAKDLTDVFARMNEAGVRGIVSSSPFPAMRQAYQNAAVTDDEVYDITAFLKYANEQQYDQHARNYMQYFLWTGGVCFVALLIVYSLVWKNRRKQAVNQRIYDRQLKSSPY